MTINIAVCDDEAHQSEYIKTLVAKWAKANKIAGKIGIYDSAESFKAEWREDIRYDILLLDIQMGGQSGVELARELRETDDSLIIVFITAMPDFVLEGYDVSALHYLMKPVDGEKLGTVLSRAAQNLSKIDRVLLLPVEGETVRVPTGDIMLIESFAHHLEITTKNTKLTVKMPIHELEGQLGENFVRCHRSYIVGLKYISKITKTDVVLEGGRGAPLSRRLAAEVNRTLIAYFRGRQ